MLTRLNLSRQLNFLLSTSHFQTFYIVCAGIKPANPAPPKRRDQADIIELFRINDPKPARLYLEKHALEMLKKFDALASAAEQTQQDERPIEKDLKQSHVVSARRRQVSS